MSPLPVYPVSPLFMLLVLAVLLALVYIFANYVGWEILKEWKLPIIGINGSLLVIFTMLILFVFFNIATAENIGPWFYGMTSYNVTDINSPQISSSDAANSVLSSLLAVILGGAALAEYEKLSKGEEGEIEEEELRETISSRRRR